MSTVVIQEGVDQSKTLRRSTVDSATTKDRSPARKRQRLHRVSSSYQRYEPHCQSVGNNYQRPRFAVQSQQDSPNRFGIVTTYHQSHGTAVSQSHRSANTSHCEEMTWSKKGSCTLSLRVRNAMPMCTELSSNSRWGAFSTAGLRNELQSRLGSRLGSRFRSRSPSRWTKRSNSTSDQSEQSTLGRLSNEMASSTWEEYGNIKFLGYMDNHSRKSGRSAFTNAMADVTTFRHNNIVNVTPLGHDNIANITPFRHRNIAATLFEHDNIANVTSFRHDNIVNVAPFRNNVANVTPFGYDNIAENRLYHSAVNSCRNRHHPQSRCLRQVVLENRDQEDEDCS